MLLNGMFFIREVGFKCWKERDGIVVDYSAHDSVLRAARTGTGKILNLHILRAMATERLRYSL